MDQEKTLPSSSGMAARTHIGGRENNEDRVFVDEQAGLYLVADGVGGHLAGEVASRITCEVLADRIHAGEDLPSAVHAANTAVHEAVRSGDGREGMASTIVAARLDHDALELAWVGDSRAYLWDGSRLFLLTRDHSLVESMLARGEIDWEEAAEHPQRNVILQALGQSPEHSLEVGMRRLDRCPTSALILLCSDGLSDVVPARDLASILRDTVTGDLNEAAETLIDAALGAEGRDNISVVLFRPEKTNAESAALTEEDFIWSYSPETDRYTFGDRQTVPHATQANVATQGYADNVPAGSACGGATLSEPAPKKSLPTALLVLALIVLGVSIAVWLAG